MESGYGCHVAALPITRMGVQVSGRGGFTRFSQRGGKIVGKQLCLCYSREGSCYGFEIAISWQKDESTGP